MKNVFVFLFFFFFRVVDGIKGTSGLFQKKGILKDVFFNKEKREK